MADYHWDRGDPCCPAQELFRCTSAVLMQFWRFASILGHLGTPDPDDLPPNEASGVASFHNQVGSGNHFGNRLMQHACSTPPATRPSHSALITPELLTRGGETKDHLCIAGHEQKKQPRASAAPEKRRRGGPTFPRDPPEKHQNFPSGALYQEFREF